ncbi:MAG TPA: TonB-dependent receptor [Sphingopyxis sp.]|nr:TonB-dependent receptor [Sphingopyxis sp.]HMP44854.1 TonB-dependent receptor [Sphingopyxis sp.]HMQ20098.1 TonB-dependent receptor [Sphingopyxis sp.]
MIFKQKRDSARMLAAVSLAAVALSSAPAFAQTAADETTESRGLEEIVVTARKVSENLQDVPVAVTVLSGDDLTDRSVQRVQDLANFTPGLLIRSGSNTPSALTITLRGQVQTDTLITLDPSVGTYVDGVYWARSYGLNADFLDVQSVQVLKGPQGTLFGRNTTGGAILMNSNNPDLNDFGGSLSLTYGRFNEFQATGVLNIPIVQDKVGLRIAGQRFRRDGFTTNVVPANAVSAIPATNPVVAQTPFAGAPNGLKLDNRDRWNGRVKLDVKPTDNLTLRFSGEYFEMDEQGPSRQARMALAPFTASNSTYNLAGTGALFVGLINGAPPATATGVGLGLINPIIANLAANPKLAAVNEVPYAFAKTKTFGFTGILDTDFGQMQLITGYRKIDAYAGVDLDGTPFAIHFTESQQSVEQLSGEFQITGHAFNDALDFAVGFFAFHEKGFDQSISIVAPAINPVTSHFYADIDNDSMGAYGQATFHISDQLSFTGGLRYSVDDKGITSLNNNFNTLTSTTTCSLFTAPPIVGPELVAVPQCAVRRRDDFSGWSYTAGFEYKPTDDLLLYIKTGKGFRSGGQNLRAPSAVFLIPFAPEIAYSHELGFKGEFFDRRLRFNAAAYQTDINNIQRSTLIAQPGAAQGASATVLGNAGKARFRGFEVETVAALTDGLRLSAFLAHVDSKYINYSDLSGDRSFEKFDSVVPWQWGAALDYTHDFGDVRLKLHADYSHFSKSPTAPYFFAQNAATVPPGSTAVPGAVNTQNPAIVTALTRDAQDLFGARASVSFADDAYELAVFVRNITNDRTFVNNLLVAPVGYISSTRNEPRTFGVTGTFRF